MNDIYCPKCWERNNIQMFYGYLKCNDCGWDERLEEEKEMFINNLDSEIRIAEETLNAKLAD